MLLVVVVVTMVLRFAPLRALNINMTDGYCAHVRWLTGTLGRVLKGEAEGSMVRVKVALAL